MAKGQGQIGGIEGNGVHPVDGRNRDFSFCVLEKILTTSKSGGTICDFNRRQIAFCITMRMDEAYCLCQAFLLST